MESIEALRARSHILPLGIDLKRFDAYGPKPDADIPTILWNHRWEYDKNPAAFFAALNKLMAENIEFRVILAGENIRQTVEGLEQARERLGSRVIHYGYVNDFASYAGLLWQSSIAVSCAWQDFFGVSMAEAIYCGCLPIMPRRVNYPDLIPAEYHVLCLYEEGRLAQVLKRHLHTPAPAGLRDSIAKFDWSTMATLYDDTFEAVIKG